MKCNAAAVISKSWERNLAARNVRWRRKVFREFRALKRSFKGKCLQCTTNNAHKLLVYIRKIFQNSAPDDSRNFFSVCQSTTTSNVYQAWEMLRIKMQENINVNPNKREKQSNDSEKYNCFCIVKNVTWDMLIFVLAFPVIDQRISRNRYVTVILIILTNRAGHTKKKCERKTVRYLRETNVSLFCLLQLDAVLFQNSWIKLLW